MNKFINKVLEAVQDDPSVRSAVYILDSKTMVRATRRLKYDAKATRSEVVITWGELNYTEDAFVKKCKKDGVKFIGLQVKFYK